MNTSYITINEAAVDDSKIEAAGTLLKEGRLVAFPTETVYGLGANALDEEAAAKIVKIIDTVEPEPELVAKYAESYQKFKQIYPACKPLFDIIK